jgi:hypothetical protein
MQYGRDSSKLLNEDPVVKIPVFLLSGEEEIPP